MKTQAKKKNNLKKLTPKQIKIIAIAVAVVFATVLTTVVASCLSTKLNKVHTPYDNVSLGNYIKLSGYKPDEEIKIVYSGLRPGEKLYEEKLMAEEGLKKTANEMIFIGKPIPFEIEQFLTQLTRLADACYNNSEDIVEMVQAIVSTFHPVGRTPQGK